MGQATLVLQHTDVSVSRTLGEIQAMLTDMGAVRIMTDVQRGETVAMTFALELDGRKVPFNLPVRFEPVFKYLQAQRSPIHRTKPEAIERDQERARKIAWRQVLLWLKAQWAMMQTGMVETAEVFMPYVRVKGGGTLYQEFKADGMKCLPAPE